MKIVSWNIRGLGTEVKIAMVKSLVCKHRVLQESKLEVVSGDLIRRIWGDDNFDFRYAVASGRSGGLITIWDKSILLLKKKFRGNRFIMLERTWLTKGWDGVLINVYAPNSLSEQRNFWAELMTFRSQFAKHWIMGVILMQLGIRTKEVIVWGC
ncbi:hypothetical protein J1N35_008092 [Gossypium stocksii]|uniref:Endonuclease/exonuclease/phosphatase domain-containing protein n=1 Tax=Gossypium stocksii TaxID=47602 RepID=A0A9D3W749_9ROSI|nr:hypothetical protein J1N35_008092 [Gossypium stocksii]